MRHFNRRQFFEWMGVIPAAVLGLTRLLHGQARQPAPRAGSRSGVTPNSVSVTITKTDSTTVRGQILAVDPDKISLRPAPRAGQGGDPIPIDVQWKQIKSVSNGLTYQKVLDEWKLKNIDKLCATCHGNRVARCPVCKGTAHDPNGLPRDCAKCNGVHEVEC